MVFYRSSRVPFTGLALTRLIVYRHDEREEQYNADHPHLRYSTDFGRLSEEVRHVSHLVLAQEKRLIKLHLRLYRRIELLICADDNSLIEKHAVCCCPFPG
jgi:hypothetical protein